MVMTIQLLTKLLRIQMERIQMNKTSHQNQMSQLLLNLQLYPKVTHKPSKHTLVLSFIAQECSQTLAPATKKHQLNCLKLSKMKKKSKG